MPRQNTLGSVGQGGAGTVEPATIGRNEPIPGGQSSGDGQARQSGGRGKSCRDQLATRQFLIHESSLEPPRIIPRIRLRKPPRQTITICTSRKSTRNRVSKKFNVRAD